MLTFLNSVSYIMIQRVCEYADNELKPYASVCVPVCFCL